MIRSAGYVRSCFIGRGQDFDFRCFVVGRNFKGEGLGSNQHFWQDNNKELSLWSVQFASWFSKVCFQRMLVNIKIVETICTWKIFTIGRIWSIERKLLSRNDLQLIILFVWDYQVIEIECLFPNIGLLKFIFQTMLYYKSII